MNENLENYASFTVGPALIPYTLTQKDFFKVARVSAKGGIAMLRRAEAAGVKIARVRENPSSRGYRRILSSQLAEIFAANAARPDEVRPEPPAPELTEGDKEWAREIKLTERLAAARNAAKKSRTA